MLKRLRLSWGEGLLALSVLLCLFGSASWGGVTFEILHDITYRTTDGETDFPGIRISTDTGTDITAGTFWINIPSASTLRFSGTTSFEVFGSAAGKVSAVNFGATTELSFTVSSPFAANEFITIFGLKVLNSGTASTATSAFYSGTFRGGTALATATRKFSVSADTLASASATQVDGSGTTALPYPNMTVNALAGTVMGFSGTTGDIRIRIPSAASLEWDTSATIAVTGSASSKVGTISYESSGTVMLVDVTSAFSASDSITLSGARFANEQGTLPSPLDWLELVLGGTAASTTDSYDLRPFYVDAAMTVTYDGSTIGTTTTGGETSMGGITIETGTRTVGVGSYTGDLYLFLPARDEIRFNRAVTSWTPTISVNGSNFTDFSLGGILDDNGGTAGGGSGLGRVLYIDLSSAIGSDSTIVISGMKVENTGSAISTAHIGVGISGPNQIDAAHSTANSSAGGSGTGGTGNPAGDCFIATGTRGRDLLILGFLAVGCAGAMLLAYLLRRARD